MALKLLPGSRPTSSSKIASSKIAPGILAGVSALTISLAAGTAAHAAPPTTEADALFEAGRVAAERGDFATACPKFAQSLRLDPGAGTLMNLADCEERSGRLADAWQHWSLAVSQLGPKDDRIPFASKRAAALDPHVPRLTIRLPAGTPSGTRVRCDELDLGSPDLRAGVSFSSAPLPLNPGDHVIVVESPGRYPRDFRITLKARERSAIDVAAGAPLPAPPPVVAVAPAPAPVFEPAAEAPVASALPAPREPEPEPEPAVRGGRTAAGIAVGGVGVIAVAIAAVTGAETIRMKNVVTDHCNSQRTCDAEGLDAGASGKTFSIVSTVAFTAGLIGLGVGTYLILSDGKSGTRTTAGLLPGGRVGLQGSF